MTFQTSIVITADGKAAKAELKALGTAAEKTGAQVRGLGSKGAAASGAVQGLGRTSVQADAALDGLASAEAAATAQTDRLGREALQLQTRLRGVQGAGALAAGGVGNLTAQFNDIGVMMMAGQNPLQLAIQQGTQISQVIGPLGARGAVASLGTAFLGLLSPVNLVTIGSIAAGAAMVQWLTGAEEDARRVKNVIEDLTDALSGFQSAQSAGQSTFDVLTEQYGAAYAMQARNLLDLKEKLAALDLQKELNGLSSMMGQDVFGDFGERSAAELRRAAPELANLQSRMEALRKTAGEAADELTRNRIAERFAEVANEFNRLGGADIQPLIDELGVGAADAARLAAAMLDLRAAQGAEAQAAAMQALRTTLSDALGTQVQMTDEGRALYDQLINGETAALQLAAAGSMIAQFLGGAADNAGRLVSAMEEARLARNHFDSESLAYSSRFRGEEEVMSQSLTPVAVPKALLPKTVRGGGGGIEADAVAKLLERKRAELDLLRATDPVQKELIRNREALAQATDAERAALTGLIANLEIEKLRMAEVDAATKDMRATLQTSFRGLVTGADSLSDALGRVAGKLADLAADAAFDMLWDGGLGAAVGGVMDWLIPKKAEGGRVEGAGGPREDNLLHWLSSGEFVVNAAATSKNLPLLEAINAGVPLRDMLRAPGLAGGGLVPAPPPIFARSAAAGAAGASAPLDIRLHLDSALLRAEIEGTSSRVAARVTEAGIGAFSRAGLPARLAEIQRHPRKIS